MPRRATKKNILFFSSYLLHSDPPCVSWTSPGLARWHSLDDVMSGLLTTLMMISSFRGYVVELQCLHVCSQCGVNSGPSQSFGHLFLKTGRLFGLGVGVLLIVNDFIWFSEWARVVGIFFSWDIRHSGLAQLVVFELSTIGVVECSYIIATLCALFSFLYYVELRPCFFPSHWHSTHSDRFFLHNCRRLGGWASKLKIITSGFL